MRPFRYASFAVFAALVGFATILQPTLPAQAAESAATLAARWPRNGPRLSAAADRMLRDALARGERLPAGWIERFHLNEPGDEPAFAEESADVTRVPSARSGPRLDDLSGDVIVNNRAPDAGSCSGCGFRLLSQAETTIASLGTNLVAGWNNSRGFCGSGAVQGYGWSTNGGLSWTDAGDPPALPGGGRYRGDPVHAVNRKTGKFYIAGIYEGGALGSGIAVARGAFSGGSFSIDLNKEVEIGGGAFLDKEWIAVDSLTGNVYVTWTPFDASDHIDFQAFDAALNPLGPIQQISSVASNGNVQGSRPVVGSNGLLYVVWYEYGIPLSHIRIRKSTDFGVTFGPEQTVADFYENGYNGAPGYRRNFCPTFPSIAVDATHGLRDGRVYVAWDETVNFYDTVFPTGVIQAENEKNDFFSRATAFNIGERVSGATSGSTDVDLYRFTANQGATIVMSNKLVEAGLTTTLRIVCPGDTANVNTYRYLAFVSAPTPVLCWTAPATGTYYLRVTANQLGNYVIDTAFDTPSSGERALGNRDQFVSWSDNGAAWSTPARVCDSNPAYDGIFPEIAVDGLGRAHCYFHDFRNGAVACGAESYEYMTSSGDGGVTWGANVRLSDASSFWSLNACGSANQGDYQGITAQGAAVQACWADSRLGDPDVYTDATVLNHGAVCPASLLVISGADTTLTLNVQNTGSVAQTLAWNVTGPGGFILGVTPSASGSQSIGAGSSLALQVHVQAWCGDMVPVGTLEVSNPAIPGDVRSCSFSAHCVNTGVGDHGAGTLAFSLPRPNPSTGDVNFAFALPASGHARLAIYGANGRRVRTLVEGELAAGTHELSWNGRDEAGRRAAPGAYFARLEAAGSTLVRTVLRVK